MRFIVSCGYLIFVGVYFNASVLSAFVGVLANLVPEIYQGWKLSGTEKEFNPSTWLRLVYQSMISKWLMTGIIFAVSFSSSIQWDYKILFIGYLLVHLSGLLTPILTKGKK